MVRAAFLLATLALGSLVADDDSPRRRVRIGGISVGASYVSGGGYYPYWGPSWWGPGYYPYWGAFSPFWYSPWIHSGLYSGFAQGPNMGQVKLQSLAKDASVYLDGAYAGSGEKRRSFWLEPGVYNLEVRDTGGRKFERKVYILSGKTLDLRPNMEVAK